MKRFNRYIHLFFSFSLFLFLLVLMSCEEKISIELNDMENERIVVEGRITNELKRHSIRLTRTASYFQNERVPPVLEAEVYLREEGSGTRFDLELVNDTFGIYETPEFEGRIGETYTIHINYSGESYQASSYLDSVAEIDSLSYEYEFVSYADQGFYKIRMSAYEPPPVGDVYMFNMYINDTLFNNALDNTPYSDDLLFDDTYMVNVEITWLPQEEIISDTNHILIEMFSTSQEEYKFINAFITETYYSGSIFNGPPANIPSNLICTTGGIDGLGFFAASAVTRQEMILYKQHDDSTNNPDYER